MKDNLGRALALVLLLTVYLGVHPVDTASATPANWMATACKSHTAACVLTPDIDTLTRTFTVADAAGVRHSYTHRADIWRIVTAHSHRCGTKAHTDPSGCYETDKIVGKNIVFPNGMHVTLNHYRS